MSTTPKADPAAYPLMRENALMRLRIKNLPDDAVHIVLMDWNVGRGTATVLAAADGTASVYLSSGGGFIGGGQKYPEIRKAALHAIYLATGSLSQFEKTEKADLPPAGDVYFYLTTSSGVRRAIAKEVSLRDGTNPLSSLGGIMQKIISEYRLKFPND